MKKSILTSSLVVIGILLGNMTSARAPTIQPPVSVYNGGRIELSPDFIDYLIVVKDYRSTHEIFRTVQYNFSEIQRGARDFLRDGTQKTQKVRQKKEKELKEKWALEKKQEEDRQNKYLLGITGKDFLTLFAKFEQDRYGYTEKKQQDYLNFLEKKLIKENQIHNLEDNHSTFCFEPSFFQSGDERAINVVKKRLKQNGLLNQESFLNNSAAFIIQQILIQEFPCTKK